MQNVIFQDLGRISYKEAWDYQQKLLKEVIDLKLRIRHIEDPAVREPMRKHYFLFCEHNPVYTLGKSGSMDHLLLNEQGLDNKGIEFFKINRGGDITFHGPGQVVGYPILDLDGFFTDVHQYVRYIEEAIIRTLAEYGLEGIRYPGFTGVWLEGNAHLPKRKICAIGVHLSRWVTMHGFAFNINTDLQYFNHIIPCGINDQDKTVTSLSVELKRSVPLSEVKTKILHHFSELFGFKAVEAIRKK
ncbi:MAG: lipoyl(octanoyl) transferase LipB [Bacteroidota bacterium]